MPNNDSTPPIDIDKALREIIARCGAVAKDPLADVQTRTLGAAVSLLVLALDESRK